MNKNIIIVLFLVVACVLAQLSLMFEVDWMQYSRAEIGDGQWWRFITGNLVHLTWRHLLMNVLGLIVIVILFPNGVSLKVLVLAIIACCLSVTIGLWVFSPGVQWYVGLSGVLHGLLVVLIVMEYFSQKHSEEHGKKHGKKHREENWLNIILFAALIVKLIWEGVMGPMPGSESAAGGAVIVQSHFYGFIGGLLYAAYIIIKNNMLKK